MKLAFLKNTLLACASEEQKGPRVVWCHCLELCAKAPPTSSTIASAPSVKCQQWKTNKTQQSSALVILGTTLPEATQRHALRREMLPLRTERVPMERKGFWQREMFRSQDRHLTVTIQGSTLHSGVTEVGWNTCKRGDGRPYISHSESSGTPNHTTQRPKAGANSSFPKRLVLNRWSWVITSTKATSDVLGPGGILPKPPNKPTP